MNKKKKKIDIFAIVGFSFFGILLLAYPYCFLLVGFLYDDPFGNSSLRDLIAKSVVSYPVLYAVSLILYFLFRVTKLKVLSRLTIFIPIFSVYPYLAIIILSTIILTKYLWITIGLMFTFVFIFGYFQYRKKVRRKSLLILTLLVLCIFSFIIPYKGIPLLKKIPSSKNKNQMSDKTRKEYNEILNKSKKLISLIKNNDFSEARNLIKNKAFLDTIFPDFDLIPYTKKQIKFILNNCYDKKGNTYLISLIKQFSKENDNYNEIIKVLKMGANPNFRSSPVYVYRYSGCFGWKGYSNPPIVIVCNKKDKEERLKLAKLLINNGADINIIRNKDNKETPAMIAAENGYLTLLKYLTSNGADIRIKDDYGNNIFYYAIQSLSIPTIKYLLQNTNIDINEKNIKGEPAIYSLIFASNRNIKNYNERKVDTLNLLVKYGVDINIQDNKGYTFLGYCIKSGSLSLTKELIGLKAIINPKNKLDLLRYACSKPNPPAVEFLLTQKPFSGLSSYEYSKKLNTIISALSDKKANKMKIEIFQMLIKNGVNMNVNGDMYGTPIIYPIQDGNYELVNEFIKSGYNINMKSRKGETALDYAIIWHKKKIADLLLEHGAKTNKQNN